MAVLVRELEKCRGCPLAGAGTQPFQQDDLLESAPVLVVRDTPGEADSRSRYARLTGLDPGAFSVASALRCQQFDNLPALVTPAQAEKGKAGLAEEALRFCENAHGRRPSGTRLIVTRGEHALWSVSRLRSASSWRGYLVPMWGHGNGWRTRIWTPPSAEVPVLVTAHSDPFSSRMDWRKVPRVLKREWPSSFPGYVTNAPREWPRVSAFDTEFDPTTGILERYSLYDGSTLRVVEARDVRQVGVPDGSTVVMHNIEADLDHLASMLTGQVRTEDTMLMHAVLWSDLPHDLEYLGSLYARTNRWKHLFYTNPLDYSGGDALGTWDVYAALVKEMKEDPQSAWIYRNSVFPLTPIIMEATTVGLKLDQARVQQALAHYEQEQAEVEAKAQALVGWPINLGSSEHVSRWLYEIEKVGVKQRRTRAKR